MVREESIWPARQEAQPFEAPTLWGSLTPGTAVSRDEIIFHTHDPGIFAALAGTAGPATGAGAPSSRSTMIGRSVCDTPPGAQGEQCALISERSLPKIAPMSGLTVIVPQKTADQKSRLMRVIAPVGVLLPSGLGLKIDQADVGRAGFCPLPAKWLRLPRWSWTTTWSSSCAGGQTATFIIFQTA